MQPRQSGSIATILIFVPLVIVPVVAIVGVPEFASVSASPPASGPSASATTAVVPKGYGPSQRYTPLDLFATYEPPRDLPPQARPLDIAAPVRTSAANGVAPRALDVDPLGGWEIERAAAATPTPRPQPTGGHTRAQLLADPGLAGESEAGAAPQRLPDFLTPASARAESPSPADDLFAPLDSPSRRSPSQTVAGAPRKGNDVRTVAYDEPVRGDDPRRLPAGDDFPEANGFPIGARPTMTWKQAVQRLNDLGVKNYNLQPDASGAGFHFSCFFAPRDNPRITHRFESEASEPLLAVEQVLKQIEAWQRPR